MTIDDRIFTGCELLTDIEILNSMTLDVNADGRINTSDVVILLKYLIGINVKIGK